MTDDVSVLSIVEVTVDLVVDEASSICEHIKFIRAEYIIFCYIAV